MLYVRVPEALKEALADYAERGGLKLTGVAVELLEQGLQASVGEGSRAELGR